ncbi:hypothetical protein QM012_007374 [Aureobasidium pullulans]|uniref:Uncharacterized protein n=1 Tax=Aureobasidium pullulans TaxID=5580 RepID=A0ABR0TMV8_AURPU
MVYLEATQTIYNNADLTYSFGELPHATRASTLTSSFTPLNHYLEEQSPIICAMLHSLVIYDKSATMSSGNMNLVVDMINSHLPNLRTFCYQVSANTSTTLQGHVADSCRRTCRTSRILQPWARLGTDIRATLELPVPPTIETVHPLLYQELCSINRLLYNIAIEAMAIRMTTRRRMRSYHEVALSRGD